MRAFEERERTGERVWTDEFDRPTRVRLEAVIEQWLDEWSNSYADEDRAREVNDHLRSFGDELDRNHARKWGYRHALVLAVRTGLDDSLPSVIDAVLAVAHSGKLEHEVDRILREERLAYRLVNGQLYPFDSLELHENVVSPTLTLLAGRPELADVEDAYQDALREIGSDPRDAITDAARALQEMLTTINCPGETLGDQLKDARRKNLLAPHDETLSAAIAKLGDWVSADRVNKGDAHKTVTTLPEDAWMSVHVVGALIVRLSEGPRS